MGGRQAISLIHSQYNCSSYFFTVPNLAHEDKVGESFSLEVPTFVTNRAVARYFPTASHALPVILVL